MIAICLSTYNGSVYLSQQLRSLETQTHPQEEIILYVRDDGSRDDSYEILHAFVQQSSLTVKLSEDRVNLGVKKSFERLMRDALEDVAEYIMFCDQDDVWQDDKIAKTYERIQEMEKEYGDVPLAVHTDLSVVDGELHPLHRSLWEYQHIDPAKDTLNRLILHNTVTGCTMMINRALAQKVSTIPSEAIMHDWWIAMVASVFGHIGYIDEPLILYRQHGGNDTGAKQYGWRYFADKLFSKPSFDKYIHQAIKFLEMYGDEMEGETRAMLANIARWDTMSGWEKRAMILRYKIFKNGLIRNIGVMVFV